MATRAAALAVLDLLRDYAGLDAQGAQVLASLHNLLARAALLARAGAGEDDLLGPLASFGGQPALSLLRHHCAEACKQQRNLTLVADALRRTRLQLAAAVEELVGISSALPPPLSPAPATQAAARAVSDAMVAATMADGLALARGVRELIAADATYKAEALCAADSSALRICVRQDWGRGGVGRPLQWIARRGGAVGSEADEGDGELDKGNVDARPAGAAEAADAAAAAERLVSEVRAAADGWSALGPGLGPEAASAARRLTGTRFDLGRGRKR